LNKNFSVLHLRRRVISGQHRDGGEEDTNKTQRSLCEVSGRAGLKGAARGPSVISLENCPMLHVALFSIFMALIAEVVITLFTFFSLA
jgi:hypothetical protein